MVVMHRLGTNGDLEGSLETIGDPSNDAGEVISFSEPYAVEVEDRKSVV